MKCFCLDIPYYPECLGKITWKNSKLAYVSRKKLNGACAVDQSNTEISKIFV